MRMRRALFTAAVALFGLCGLAWAQGRYADWRTCPKFSWEKNWEEWAKITGNEDWARWAKKLQDPNALKLGRAWAEYLGYDAVSIINKSTRAPKVVPGTVITPENYTQFEGLEEIMWPSVYRQLKPGYYGNWKKIIVVPTTHYYSEWGLLEWTKKYEGQARITAEHPETLLNYTVGLPFPHIDNSDPLAAAKVVHNFDRRGIFNDQWYAVFSFQMWGRKGKPELLEKCSIFWRQYATRYEVPPVPRDPAFPGVQEKGSLIMYSPYDIKGYAGVRTRYLDPNKEDSFVVYLPFLRRVRVLSGADTMDPIIGTDYKWEDWKTWWQKMSHKMWPMKFEMVDANGECLAPWWGDAPPKVDVEGNTIIAWWERRPVWVIDVIMLSPKYCYSKKRVWIDKETFHVLNVENYDPRGRYWKNDIFGGQFIPEKGYHGWWWCDCIDEINWHRSVAKMQSTPNDPRVNDNFFNLAFLRRLAH